MTVPPLVERVVLQRRSGIAAPGGFFLCALIGAAVFDRAASSPSTSWGGAAAFMVLPLTVWIVAVLRTPHLVTLLPRQWAVEVSTGRGPLRTAKRLELLPGEPVRVITRSVLIPGGHTSRYQDITTLLVGDQAIPLIHGGGAEEAVTRVGHEVAHALGTPLQVTREGSASLASGSAPRR